MIKKFKEIITLGNERANKVIEEHIDQLHMIAKELLEHETLKAEDFLALVDARPVVENLYVVEDTKEQQE